MSRRASSPFERVNIDVLQGIVDLLSVEDINNVRLASTTLASKCLGTTYLKSFRRRTIRWRLGQSLTDFERSMDLPQVGLQLRDLTILAVVDLRKEERINQQASIKVLSEALKQYRENSRHTCIRSISLQLCDIIVDGMPTQVETAQKAANMALKGLLDSLANADLGTSELDIFSTSQRGSIALNSMRVLLERPQLRRLVESVTRLQISIYHGDHILPFRQRGKDEWKNAEGALKLIRLCPQLATLHLHWYRVSVGWGFNGFEHECQLFDDIHRSDVLSLHCVRLRTSNGLPGQLLDFTSRTFALDSVEMNFEHFSDSDTVPCFNNIVGDYNCLNVKQLNEEHSDWELLASPEFKLTETGKQHEKGFQKKGIGRPTDLPPTRVWYRITWHQPNSSAALWIPTLERMRLRGPMDSESIWGLT